MAPAHHQFQMLQRTQVFQRIVLRHNKVCALARLNGTGHISYSGQLCIALRGGRAAAVALVAKQMAAAGQAVLPEALLPDYHRLSQAERERAERLAAEAAAKKEKA